MCGICGFWDRRPGAVRSESELVAMGETIVHRGPDSHGSTVHDGVGLHSRRLKIIDLEGGDQPLYSEDGRVAVVYNGEIFNFKELRRDLEDKGYRFRTQTDSEVLVHLYMEHGIDKMLPLLNGFFGFAVHDRRRNQLFLVRDRMGVKPLYYAETDIGLSFGSELKTLLAEGSLSEEIDPTALVDFFTLRYIPAPKTIYRDARKLPAGHYLRYDGEHLLVQQWWDLPEFGTRTTGSTEDWADELWDLVEDSVRLRLMSDVPLGAFLSGGLDSSGVVTAMHRLQGSSVKAVSIGFEDSDLSELAHAERVAQGLEIEHITDVLRPEVIGLVDQLGWFFDEPFADPSAIPTSVLAERTRREVTVALSGDGGDECWAGYRRYRFDWAENQVRRLLPGPVFRGLFRGLGALYPQADFLPRPLRAKTTLQNLGRDPLSAYFRSVCSKPVAAARALLHPDLRQQTADYHPIETFRPWFDRAPGPDALSRVQDLDFHTWLPEYIMTKTDRATMAHSLEAREPLLDHRLVEFAASLPHHVKLRSGDGKWLLKRAFERHLPPQTIRRPKQGFSPPLRRWINEDLRGRVEQMEVPRWLDPQLVRSQAQAHLRGARDHSELLYQVLVLSSFERRWSRRFAPELVGTGG